MRILVLVRYSSGGSFVLSREFEWFLKADICINLVVIASYLPKLLEK